LLVLAASAVCFAGENDDLFDAAQRGNVEKVKLLLADGADVNFKDPMVLGHTPLTIAATFGRTETVKVLLDHGAAVGQQTDDGASALQCGASAADSQLVRLLLDRGADVNHRDKFGRTPLFGATCADCPPENARLLLAKGADVNAQDNEGRTAFYYAQAHGNQDVVAVLVKAGANGGKMPAAPPTRLIPADIKFLADECKIGQPDIDAILKLDAKTKQILLSRIALRDCSLLHAFTASRSYFRLLKPNAAMPLPPPEWNTDYLTPEEVKQYQKILEEAPM
jgi:hypothetical protein